MKAVTIAITSSGRGSGKTLLAESIIKKLSSLGFRVLALKLIHHGAPDMLAGKDAERMFMAGAWASVAWGEESALVIVRRPSLNNLLRLLSSMGPTDVIVVEGFEKLVETGLNPDVVIYVASGRDSGDKCESLTRGPWRLLVAKLGEGSSASREAAMKCGAPRPANEVIDEVIRILKKPSPY